ncbi:MAG: peptide/nickel transport system permease protein [Solirubrobacteraceae bacterium]
MLIFVAAVAILAPVIEPYDPAKQAVGAPLQSPTPAYPAGTDAFGRDQLSRLIAGAQISVMVAVIVALVSVLLGGALGLVLGYRGGRIDFVVGRVLDVAFSFPDLLLALVLSAILGAGLKTVTIALCIIYIPVATRFVRGVVTAERAKDYVSAARVTGASPLRIMFRHIVPNIVSPVLVLATSIMAFSILAEAALSYLGFGSQPPTSSWGKMLSENIAYVSTEAYLVIIPGLAITFVVVALSLLGDGLRDYLDPRQRLASERVSAGHANEAD